MGNDREILEAALQQWQARRQVQLEADVQERLQILLELWKRYSRAFNLTSATTTEQRIDHIRDGLDSAVVADRAGAPRGGAWLDIGSGGGFPGLIVAATGWYPVTLVEPRQRRASFLQMAARTAGLWTTVVRQRRIERATWNQNTLGGTLDGESNEIMITSARAVFAPLEWLGLGIHIVNPTGHVVLHLPATPNPALRAQLEPFAAELDGPFGPIAAKKAPPKKDQEPRP